MRGLLLLGGIALCIVLVAASHQDQAESQIEAKNERAQGDLVNDREIRSTDGKKKKTKPTQKPKPGMFSAMAIPSDMKRGDLEYDGEIRSTDGKKKKTKPTQKPKPGMFSAMARPSNTREIRSIDESIPQDQTNRRRCPGCYSPVFSVETREELLKLPLRRQRDTEKHEKLKKKHKHLKEKSKARRRNKNHKERHAHLQGEDPAIGDNNNKRRKYHRGKKDKDQRRSGRFSLISNVDPNINKMNIHDTQDKTE